jgi:hypothetical protein
MDGDVHVVHRKALGLVPYQHFGVEMPSGDICENSLPGIRVVTFGSFARRSTTSVQNPDATPAERAQTVARAESRVSEHRYSLLGNNCEHFANWCATGAAVSHQVVAVAQQAIAIIGAMLRAAFVATCALLAFSAARAAFAD